MAGGIGSRFWPMSKTEMPKQFLDILGTGKSLIQMTWDRLSKIAPTENIFVVTNTNYISELKSQIPSITDEQILAEPARRNTAPCIAYASYKIHSQNPNANLVVAPSDHLILNENEFVRCINKALNVSQQEDSLVTLGIQPSRPDTGYGYIQSSNTLNPTDSDFHKVKTFTEKPELEMAQQFLDSGDFNWNSGIFVWSSKSIIHSFSNYLPDMHELFVDGNEFYFTEKENDYISKIYQVCTNISIDYAIMEKSNNVYVLPCDIGWSDLGTWGSLYTHLDHDDENNGIVGNRVRVYESSNNVVHVPKNKLVVLQGLNDYIVVESDNTLLVCQKSEEQKIKTIVNDLKLEFGEEYI